jgi:ribokinase
VGRVVVVGKAGLELALQLPRIPEPAERLVGQGRWGAGGRGLKTALSLQQAGLHPYLITRVGDDIAGRFVDYLVHRARIEAHIARDAHLPTATSIPLSLPQAYSRIEVPGAELGWDPDSLLSRLEALGSVEWLWLQGEIPREVNLVAALWVKDHGGQVAVDPEPAREIGEELMAIADYLFPTAEGLGILCRSQPPRSRDEAQLLVGWLLSRHPGLSLVMLPQVAEGALVASQEGYWWVTPNAEARGDGCSIAARFFAALTRGQGMEAALREAVGAAGER